MPDWIPWASPSLQGNENAYVQKALASTWISGGPYIERFEQRFAERNNSRFCVSTSNGTTALQLALLALGIGPGDEVIVPGYTFMAPANMTLAVGATPRFVEIDLQTWGIDPRAVESAITPKTRAIVAAHLYGNVCDMQRLRDIAQRRGVPLIEDTAESAFSTYDGACAGTFGDLGCFSFQATKTITMGEGGAVLTDRENLFEKMTLIRNHGMRPERRYFHEVVGFNFRLTNLQAAVGCAQLDGLNQIIESRRALYERYLERLPALEGVVPQAFDASVDPVVWTMAVRLDPDRFGPRDAVIDRMRARGIETRPGFYSSTAIPLYECSSLPIADRVSREVVCLPLYPGLSLESVDRICDSLRSLGGHHAVQGRLSA